MFGNWKHLDCSGEGPVCSPVTLPILRPPSCSFTGCSLITAGGSKSLHLAPLLVLHQCGLVLHFEFVVPWKAKKVLPPESDLISSGIRIS